MATAAQAELISSLAQDEIPIKLRCAICSRLAVNAFRLPCCDQAICESCQSTLPSSCPVCEHTPVAGEDCKPNKSLRTTIKVFLRTEEKKREALRLKEVKNTPPDTPCETEQNVTVVPEEAPVPEEAAPVISGTPRDPTPAIEEVEEGPSDPLDANQSQEAQQDIPQQSIEEIAPGQESIEEDLDTANNNGQEDQDGSKELADKDGDDQATGLQGVQGFGTGFGFDPTAAGGFNNMAFGAGGDFNQMQMMMAMQNGMAPNNFGNFPMMGMPGMNMDPMTMQNMFMNGGFGAAGMGMNGMNMGMGMGGFDGGIGSGFNNGWNQQQSWNVGPDNFNHPNAAGMGHGDYGANNPGFPSNAAGYNQGNFGRGGQFNDFQNNYGNQGYQARGRGRGRGGFNGRGGYGYGQNDALAQQFPQQFGTAQHTNGPISETGSIPTGPKADMPASNVDEFGREIRQASTIKEESTGESGAPGDGSADGPHNEEGATGNGGSNEMPQDGTTKEPAGQNEDDSQPKPIQTLDELQAASFNAPNGPAGFHQMSQVDMNGRNYGFARGGFAHNFRGRGGFGMQPPPVKAVPINAPTGPKAMREGLPNTGLSSLRGRGFSVAGGASSRPVPDPVVPTTEPEKVPKEKDRSRSPSQDRDRSRSRSRDRRRDRDRDERHRRKHRHRSASRSDDERESERRRERRKERRSRHHDEDEGRDIADDDKDKPSDSIEDHRQHGDEGTRSRSASPARSSHRSRRDKEKDRYREKDRGSDKDREYKSSSHKHRPSHRSHRDDRSRSRDRDRDRDREYRHSRRHESRRGSADVEGKDDAAGKEDDADNPSRKSSLIISSNGIEIKGASTRRAAETKMPMSIPTGPSKDRNAGPSGRDRDREKDRSSRYHDDRHRSSRHHDRDSERTSGGREKETRDAEKDKDKDKPKAPPTGPAALTGQDPHTLEREARNRERLLKEAQRIAGMASGLGRKRSRDDEGDDAAVAALASSGRKGRKKGRRGGGGGGVGSGTVNGDESEEARLSRLEAEREAARWG
ncbi:pre-mRNA-splicing factor 38B [Phlyctema vagabunda]|uniref:Pre-mRNA-splicing factor 38B n=1 Tax=Phlyctema vagabunda TaxID=108571 RepID=A0ABR4P7G5_9HELO